MERICWRVLYIFLILFLSSCGDDGGSAVNTANSPEDSTFTVELTRIGAPASEPPEVIQIPDGRPIYALLVSGFHQNSNLDMFHYYNFAKCLLEKGAYVHYAWWNNLLAPYMERPLHNENSVPSTGPLPVWDMINLFSFPSLFTKARPVDDYQFQQDAEDLINAIHENNPDATIILVGHSMGGDSVARLASNIDSEIEIALVAPIDPVGNRTCVSNYSWGGGNFCNGLFNFTRWRATHLEWMTNIIFLYDPPRRSFGSNIKYLYHRWQQEFAPPFDWTCPQGSQSGSIPDPVCASLKPESEYLFVHPAPLETSIFGTSTNVQSLVATSLYSGYDVYPRPGWPENSGGGLDGHGEIVGFRGVIPGTSDSYPMALLAPDYWPSLAIEKSFTDETGRANVRNLRVSLLKDWEKDHEYLDNNEWAPTSPDYCMVSDDLCTILKTKLGLPEPPVNTAPLADAGPDQIVECSSPNGTEVALDGSGSSDPDGDPLTFTWAWQEGTTMGESVYTSFPLGTHLITLTVDDGRGKSGTDSVDVTVTDTTPPTLSVSLSPDVLWPPKHKLVTITASIQVSDTCDDSPTVKLVSITSNEPDNGSGDGHTSDDIQGAEFDTDDREFLLRAERSGMEPGRIYTVTYEATDASGNVTVATAEVTVPHDQHN